MMKLLLIVLCVQATFAITLSRLKEKQQRSLTQAADEVDDDWLFASLEDRARAAQREMGMASEDDQPVARFSETETGDPLDNIPDIPIDWSSDSSAVEDPHRFASVDSKGRLHVRVTDFKEKTAGFEGEYGSVLMTFATGRKPANWSDGFTVASSPMDSVTGRQADKRQANIRVTVDNTKEGDIGCIELITSHFPISGGDAAMLQSARNAFICFKTATLEAFNQAEATNQCRKRPFRTFILLDRVLRAYNACVDTSMGGDAGWKVSWVSEAGNPADWFAFSSNNTATRQTNIGFPFTQVNYGFPFNRIGCAPDTANAAKDLIIPMGGSANSAILKHARTVAKAWVDAVSYPENTTFRADQNVRSLVTLYAWQAAGYCRGRQKWRDLCLLDHVPAINPDDATQIEDFKTDEEAVFNDYVWKAEVAHKNIFHQMPKLDLFATRKTLEQANALDAWWSHVWSAPFNTLPKFQAGITALDDDTLKQAIASIDYEGCMDAVLPRCATRLLGDQNPYTARLDSEDPEYGQTAHGGADTFDWDFRNLLHFNSVACARNFLLPGHNLKVKAPAIVGTDHYGLVMESRLPGAGTLAQYFAQDTGTNLATFKATLAAVMDDGLAPCNTVTP